jgi:hypothetical protein
MLAVTLRLDGLAAQGRDADQLFGVGMGGGNGWGRFGGAFPVS